MHSAAAFESESSSVPLQAQRMTLDTNRHSISRCFCSDAVSRSASIVRIHPYRILSSLPNLIRDELNEIPVENCQISFSVSRNNEKSCSTGCSTHYLTSIIDRNIIEKLLSSTMVVRDVFLKLSRKSGIAFQTQTERRMSKQPPLLKDQKKSY